MTDMHACVCVCARTHTHTRTHAHTYTHTLMGYTYNTNCASVGQFCKHSLLILVNTLGCVLSQMNTK